MHYFRGEMENDKNHVKYFNLKKVTYHTITVLPKLPCSCSEKIDDMNFWMSSTQGKISPLFTKGKKVIFMTFVLPWLFPLNLLVAM